MLDMGSLPDVKKIVQLCAIDRQTLLFSATIPPEIESLSSWVLRDPEIVEIGVRRAVAETVTHAFYPVAVVPQIDVLVSLPRQKPYSNVRVFFSTKQRADPVSPRTKELLPLRSALPSEPTP